MEVIEQEKETTPTESQEIDLFLPNSSPQSVDTIHRQRRHFAAMKTANLSRYLERERSSQVTPRLVILNGWSDTNKPSANDDFPPQLLHHLLKDTNESIIRCGGYWVQLGGVGIVINPGRWFLERFHAAGLHLWDIDHVIITDGKESASFDVERLWTFNKEINTLLKEWHLAPHVISYWLHPIAFERCAPLLRPLFREERATVHRLETFHDISTFETVELNSTFAFDYSSTAPVPQNLSPLMVRFHPLQQNQEATKGETQALPLFQEAFPLGFVSHAPWNEVENTFLSSCKTLVLGIGETPFEEIASLKSNPSSLGYSGAIKILGQSATSLAIIAEQGLSEGDIRIESLKHLRQELQPRPTTILPAEEGVTVYLDSLHMTGPSLATPTPCQTVRTVRSGGPFSRLAFLDECSVL